MRVSGDAHVLPTDCTVVTVAKGTHLCDPPWRGRVVWNSPSFKAELLYPSTPTTLDTRHSTIQDRRPDDSKRTDEDVGRKKNAGIETANVG